MALILAKEILPGDKIKIDARYEHEDLAGLQIDLGVIAVAQSLKSKEFLIFPDDTTNPEPYIMNPMASALLRYREKTGQLHLVFTDSVS